MSQFLFSSVNSCKTTKAKSELAPSWEEGIKFGRLGTQGSDQIRIEASFPTWKQAALATSVWCPLNFSKKEKFYP